MQRVAAVGLVALLGGLALMSVGCVAQDKYDALLLQNKEQGKLLEEKEAQVAALNERTSAMEARLTDAQRTA